MRAAENNTQSIEGEQEAVSSMQEAVVYDSSSLRNHDLKEYIALPLTAYFSLLESSRKM